jgi:competence protein ComEC
MPLLWLSSAFLLGIWLGEIFKLPLAAWLALAFICLLPSLYKLASSSLPFTLPLPGAEADPARAGALPARAGALPATESPHSRISSFFHRLSGSLSGLVRDRLPQPPLPYSLLLTVLCLGAARLQLAQPAFIPQSLVYYNDREYPFVVEGTLLSPPDLRDDQVLIRLKAEKIGIALHPQTEQRLESVEGILQARLPAYQDLQYGDRLRLEGFLLTPPELEDFSYRDYLARQGIFSLMNSAQATRLGTGGQPFKAWIWSARRRALDVIYAIFPDPEASLMAGILLGIEGGIPDDLYQDFRDTGTSHVIAISGFNMAIVAGFLAFFFSRAFGPRWGAVAAILGVGLYTLLVGGGAGVVRAAIMAGLGLFAAQVGRRQTGLNSLAFVAAIMALVTPYVLWDISFQLSFMATLGLVLFATPLSDGFQSFASRRLPQETVQRISRPVSEFVLFTLAAQAMTLPVVLYHFRQFSLVSLIANPLILPAQPPLMMLGGAAVLLGLPLRFLGQVIAYLAWPFPAYTIRVVESLAQLPGASIPVGPNAWLGFSLTFFLLIGLVVVRHRLPFLKQLWKPGLLVLVLSSLAIVVWRIALGAPDGRLHLTVLDVGADGRSGDAFLIQTPSGARLLIDGGPSPNRLSSALGPRLPPGRKNLDWLLVAGVGDGQIGALPQTLARLAPRQMLWSGPPDASARAAALRQEAARLGIPLTDAQSGQRLDLGDGAVLHILEVTERGMVLLLEWGSFRALLPVGLEFETLDRLDPGPITALLLAESGYAPLTTPEWIERLQPQVALLSVAPGDRDGLPDPEALEAVGGINLLRTDQHGWIELSTDGEQMWVEVER